jgi:hypothetical protein
MADEMPVLPIGSDEGTPANLQPTLFFVSYLPDFLMLSKNETE